MKKQTMLTALLFWLAGATAMAQKLSVIEGQWIEPTKQDKELNLYKIENGNCEELASSVLTSEGRFGFAFYPEKEGYYAIGKNERSKVNRYVFYFKPGDNLQFQIVGDSWKLVGENTPENMEMERWHELVQPLEDKAVYFMHKRSTYKDYFPLLEQKLPEVKAYAKATTPNARFNESFEEFKKYNFVDINLALLNTPRSAHPKSNEFIAYFRNLKVEDFSTSLSLLDYPGGVSLLSSLAYTALRMDSTLTQEQVLEKHKNTKAYLLGTGSPIQHPVLKGEMLLELNAYAKDYATVALDKEMYGSCLVTDDQQRRFNAILGKLDDQSQGHAAIDFKFPDINGKEVALSDFKGKVVYIDIWATWCGPCKGEIPYMGKLEEEFKDNPNIVFLSVSIDKGKDQQKWKDMVREKQMKGVQLFAGDRSEDIAGPYKVRGIPRFVLVGKDGKLIAGDAPRPSSVEIRPLLKKALAQ